MRPGSAVFTCADIHAVFTYMFITTYIIYLRLRYTPVLHIGHLNLPHVKIFTFVCLYNVCPTIHVSSELHVLLILRILQSRVTYSLTVLSTNTNSTIQKVHSESTFSKYGTI